MADVVDLAENLSAVFKDAEINKIRHEASRPSVITNNCRYCDDVVDHKQFCDSYCRDAWDNEKKLRVINNRG